MTASPRSQSLPACQEPVSDGAFRQGGGRAGLCGIAKHYDLSELSADALFELWRSRPQKPRDELGIPYQHPGVSHEEVAAAFAPYPSHRALLLGPTGQIMACNAVAALRAPEGTLTTIDDLPLDAGALAQLHLTLNSALRNPTRSREVVRALHLKTGHGFLMALSRLERPSDAKPLAFMLAIELIWSERGEELLAHSLEATPRQITILKGLALGQSYAGLQALTGLPLTEIHADLRGLFAKSGTLDLMGLLLVTFTLLDLATAPPSLVQVAEGAMAATRRQGLDPICAALMPACSEAGQPRPANSHLLTLEDGRVLEWLDGGAADGRPVLYMHFSFGLTHWSDRALRAARQRGLRIITPLRAGFGATSKRAPGVPVREGAVADYLRICDHLQLERPLIVSQGSDLRYAVALAEQRPAFVRGILGCAAQLPLANHSQFERLGKWQRFVLGNARYAPDVLPAVMKAALTMMHGVGIEGMLRILNEGSPADIAALNTPEIRDALVGGMGYSLPPTQEKGVQTLVEECRDAETDWTELLRQAQLPIRLLQPDQDALMPLRNLQDLEPEFPNLDIRILRGSGQFLLFQRWQEVLDSVEELWRMAE